MFLKKEELANLSREAKNLILRGTFSLYKRKETKQAPYIIKMNGLYFSLDNTGKIVNELKSIKSSQIGEKVYFLDSFNKTKNLHI